MMSLLQLAFLSLSYIIASIIYSLFFHPLSHIPGPLFARISSLPSLYHACKGDRHIWLWQQFQIYGRRFRATPNLVVFNTPDAYNDIYSYKANVKRSRFYDTWSRNSDDVSALTTSDMGLHARKRRLLNLAFTDQSVKASGPLMARHIDRWNELLPGEKADRDEDGWSEPRDMAKSAGYLTFDIVGELSFGADFQTKEPGDNKLKDIPHIMDELMAFSYPFALSPSLDLLLWLKPRGLDNLLLYVEPKGIAEYYNLVEELVTRRLKEHRQREQEQKPSERQDILHFLCSATDPETGNPAFELKELLAEANLLMVAGSDTSSTILCAIFFYLAHNQRVYLKLVKEIRDTFTDPDQIVHGPQLASCKYLRACIDEALRMAHSGSSELPREVLAGGQMIDGEVYPQGTIVGTPNWALGRNEETYGDANTFRPERWIVSDDLGTLNTEEDVKRLKRALHTFLRGPGDCVGQKIAMLQLTMVIARTVWRLDFRVTPGTHVGEGRDELGWGQRDRRQYMVTDAYVAQKKGPLLQFRSRAE